jgi:hypothetical protein
MIFGKKSSEEADKLKDQIEQLEAQNKVLLETLEFYANPDNWEVGHKYRDADDATIFTDGDNSAVTTDAGKKASRTLYKIKKG